MMWQSIGAPNHSCFTNNTSLYWIWTKPADDACKGWFEDWFIIAPELFPRYHIAESSREPWKMYKNIYDVGTVTYPQECDTFLDWDFFAVAKDDVAVGHGGYFCNFKRALGDKPVPNLARIHSSQKFTEYVANPEKQPPATAKNESIFKIEIDPTTYPDIDNFDHPFSTVAKIPGGYAHFINAAKYGQTPDETWKNEWVKLKITINIPGVEALLGSIPKSLGVWLYYEDPDLDDSWNSPPTNPNNLRTVEFDPSGIGIGNDNLLEYASGYWNVQPKNQYKYDKAGFTISDVESIGPVSYQDAIFISRDDFIANCNAKGELYAYFRTGKYGGNNYKIKAIVGIPSCFMWDEISTINVWTKYPLYTSTVKGWLGAKGVGSAEISEDLIKVASSDIKGAFDDGFKYVYVYDDPKDTSPYEVANCKSLTKIIYGEIAKFGNQNCGYHTPRSIYENIVSNPHGIVYPYYHNGSNVFGSSHIEYTDKPYDPQLIISEKAIKDWIIIRNDFEVSNLISNVVIHELGHVIMHYIDKECPFIIGDPSVMVYEFEWDEKTGEKYPNELDKLVLNFSRPEIEVMRANYKGVRYMELINPKATIKYYNNQATVKANGLFLRRTYP